MHRDQDLLGDFLALDKCDQAERGFAFLADDLDPEESAKEPTHYDGNKNTIFVNFMDLAKKSPDEQCATLCHELFHFFHKSLDPRAYRYRVTSSGSTVAWSNAEEELTITGTCPSVANNQDNWEHSLFNENEVLRDLGLPERTSHGAPSSSMQSIPRKGISFVL